VELHSSFQSYVREIKGYIYLSAALFTVSVITGYLYAHFVPEKSMEFFSDLQKVMVRRFAGMEAGGMAFAIFINNIFATFIILVFGLAFGFLPGMGLVVNGLLLGVVAYMVKKKSILLLFSIIPHGIFEIPVFLMSAAIGLRLGHQVIRKLMGAGEVRLLEELKKGLYFYFKWGVPFLFVAAFIESFLSLRLAHFFS
jgi:stage II sporulation protein M